MERDDNEESRPAVWHLTVLGPVAARRGNRRLNLGPPLQRAALCVLAAQAGQTVTRETLISGLWGEGSPRTAQQSIYTYIAGLRRELEPDVGPRGPFTLLVNRSGGYALPRGTFQIDAEEFESRVAEARRLLANGNRTAALWELEAALELWTGQALCGIPGPFAETERGRLEELRLTANEDRAQILLELGRHQEAVAALHDLVGRHPLRERARETLMLALYRCGRQADALETYLEIRHLLAERLGVDPGESLRKCYEAILRGDPELGSAHPEPVELAPAVRAAPEPTVPTPRQLPRAVDGFVGRAEESLRLRALLTPREGGDPQAVVVITGPAGAGKSAVAIQAAHAVSDHFPDGRLYANLLGATPGVERLKPIDVLGRFLRALGMRCDAVPHEVDEAAAALRDRLAGRRVLIVLDDAAGPEQVRPLLNLPSGNAVLITSRESFAAVDDCTQIRLGMMPRSEAFTMLAKLIGSHRVTADPAATARLVDLCAGLPLALRVAAARLIDRPHWSVRHLVERLEDRGRILHELESGDIAVRSSLELSYHMLSGSTRRLDRMAARALCHLGILHVPEVTAHVVAALLDAPVDVAERALERLVEAHLVESHTYGRFQLHDLVRLFTMALSEEHLPRQRRSDALNRVLAHYGATVRLAIGMLDPHRVLAPWPEVDQEPVPFADGRAAYRWLERERGNVLAAAAQAMASPDDAVARMGTYVAFSLKWYLYRAGHRNDDLRIYQQALRTCERLGDRELLALAHGFLAMALRRLDRAAEALPHQQFELDFQRDSGDRFGEMRALGNLSTVYLELGRYTEALETSKAQLALAQEIGTDVGERHALGMLGCAYKGLGNMTTAAAYLGRLLALARNAGDRFHEIWCRRHLAEIFLEHNDLWPAKSHLERALHLIREMGDHDIEPECLTLLARADRLLHRPEDALAYARAGIELAQAMGDRNWEKLAGLELAAAKDALSADPQGQKQIYPVGQRG